ncbi:hypothetical protein ACHAWX_004987 [Stephanocyclus meneghinianus]
MHPSLQSFRGQGMLHKRWKLVHAREIANQFTQELLKISYETFSEYGNLVTMDMERGFRVSIKALGLTTKAQNSGVEIAITGDGAAITTLTNNAGQCCIGFMFLDIDARDPTTGQPCFYADEKTDEGITSRKFINAQSTNTPMPIGICLQCESKNVLQGAFGKFFHWCKTSEHEGIPIGDQPTLKPIKLVGTGDMSFESKLLGTGGACKVMYNFCPWCEVHGVKLFVKVNLKETLSPDGTLSRPINDYCHYLLHMEESDDIIAKTSMVYDPRAVSKSTTSNNIDYIYQNDISAEDNAFMGNIFSDLRLSGLSGDSINEMTLEERVSTLKHMLMTRMLLQTYRDALRIDKDTSAEIMLDPGQVIPCILHHNNRTTKKISKLLLKIAL